MASFTGKPETQIVLSKRELERVNRKRSKILAKILEAKKLLTVRIFYLKSVFAAIFADMGVSRLHEPRFWLNFNVYTIPSSMSGDSFAVRTGFQSTFQISQICSRSYRLCLYQHSSASKLNNPSLLSFSKSTVMEWPCPVSRIAGRLQVRCTKLSKRFIPSYEIKNLYIVMTILQIR